MSRPVDNRTAHDFLSAAGAMNEFIAGFDWSGTSLGDPETWSDELRSTVRLLFSSPLPAVLWWGREHVSLYNDAYGAALGRRAGECWPEIRESLEPLIETACKSGTPALLEDLELTIEREAEIREAHFSVACSPAAGGGVLATFHEITEKVLAQRRVRILRELSTRTADAKTAEEACQAAAAAFASHPRDIAFALLYLTDESGRRARLAARCGQHGPAGSEASEISLDEATGMPDAGCCEGPNRAVPLPLRLAGRARAAGLFVAGVGARLAFDRDYADFLELAKTQIASGIVNAEARAQERSGRDEMQEALRGALDRYQHQVRLFESMASTTTDLVCLFDLEGRFLYANQVLLDMVGLKLEDVVGKLCTEIGFGELTHEHKDREIARAVETRATVTGELILETPLTGAKGIYEYIFSPVKGPDGRVEEVTATVRDVTERRTAERQLAENAARQKFLIELADALRPLSDPTEIQYEASRILGERLRASRAGYAECLDEQGTLLVRRHYANASASVEGRHRLSDYGGNLLSQFCSGKLVVHEDIVNDPGFGEAEKKAFARLGLGAMAHVPLVKGGRLAAVLFVHYSGPHPFSAAELSLMEEVAERTWWAVERVSGEMALRESEEKFRSLFESMDEGFAICEMVRDGNGRPVDYRFVELNPAFEKQTGMEVKKIRGRMASEAIPGLSEGWLRAFAEVVETKRPARFDHEAEPLKRWYQVSAFPRKGDRFAFVLDDITGRRTAEEALRRSEARYRSLFENTLDAVFMTYRNGSITAANPAACAMFGMTEAEICRAGRDGLVDPKDARRAAALHRLRRQGRAQTELTLRRKDGSSFEGEVSTVAVGEKGQTFVLVRDITARKQGEEALRRSEALYRSIARNLPDGMVFVVDCDMRCVCVEGELTSKLALKREEAEGQILAEGAEGDGLKPARGTYLRRALNGETVSEEAEIDGILVWTQYTPLRGDSGKIAGAMMIAADVTERKRQEERLRQRQKLESVGMLAGGIAHDFNNLLTSVLGYATLLVEDAAPQQVRHLNHIIQGAEKAADLTRQLLAYAGQGQFVLREIDVSKAVNEFSNLMECSIPNSVQLHIAAQKRLPTIQMDEAQFQQVLMNLVINAGEAIGEGNKGTITVATYQAEFANPFVDTLGEQVAAGRYVVIEVRDTGSGMDEEDRRRIFEPFFTTKFTGRGLGLSAVGGILRSLKGGITVNSRPRIGSRFRVFLPVSENVVEAAAPENASPAPSARGTVLVVEDEGLVREFIGAVLKRRGYVVLSAADGRQAVEFCERHGERIDAAVLDVVMPGMSARDVLPLLKAKRPGIKVLLTSGHSEDEARGLCAADPDLQFIQKPYTAQEIARVVEELIGAGRE